jgi:DNA recombination protein RmuC
MTQSHQTQSTIQQLSKEYGQVELRQQQMLHTQFNASNERMMRQFTQFQETLMASLHEGLRSTQHGTSLHLKSHSEAIAKQIAQLNHDTQYRLRAISTEVERRLESGFEKTNQTFVDVVKRLALIDDAQKKIAELSGNVVSLQEVLSDKRSRGAFGEVQLSTLIKNVLPTKNYAFQHTLSNNRIADCMLFLPEPTGNIAIDSKFPLESYARMTSFDVATSDKELAKRQFKQDIKKHLNDIASKYIIKGETSEGAMMFIPAEAIFAEIHAYHMDLVEMAHKLRVWMVSPSTMMAVLTTASAVLKDEATNEQVCLIREHLQRLSLDFSRFEKRMNNLAKHIDQAQQDVKDVHTSASKISRHFRNIENVELSPELEASVRLSKSI